MDRSIRSRRWDNFQQRLEYAPDGVYVHQKRGWRYVPVHPFGDEPDVLARLSLKPEDCRSADLWWGIDHDATLLQATACTDRFDPGLYARQTDNELHWTYLFVVIEGDFVTRAAVEAAMEKFSDLGFPSRRRFELLLDQNLSRVD